MGELWLVVHHPYCVCVQVSSFSVASKAERSETSTMQYIQEMGGPRPCTLDSVCSPAPKRNLACLHVRSSSCVFHCRARWVTMQYRTPKSHWNPPWCVFTASILILALYAEYIGSYSGNEWHICLRPETLVAATVNAHAWVPLNFFIPRPYTCKIALKKCRN